MKTKRKYWILFKIEECVLCGITTETRTRVYDRPKPQKVEDRYKHSQYACGVHFC